MIGINNININKQNFKTRAACRVCNGHHLEKFLVLGPTPLANSYLIKEQLSQAEDFYPLDVYFCRDCYLVQLLDVVSPEVMFQDYAYLTGASNPMKLHFADMARDIIDNFNLNKDQLVVDVGSNDGTFLSNFVKAGFKVLGVDPAANVAPIAQAQGVPTLVDFFNEECALRIKEKYGPAQVIVAANVFAHNDGLEGFTKGVSNLLANDGVFIIEAPYFLNMLDRLEFDTIYHEHLSCLSLHPLVHLFARFGMAAADVKEVPVHGGSLRVFVKKLPAKPSANVERFLAIEKERGVHLIETYQKLAQDIAGLKEKLNHILRGIKQEGQNNRIVGYGATAKSCTLLNYCGIGADLLDYIVDSTSLKQGKYTPGTHIPIFPEEKLRQDNPEYTLLLAWNYASQIMQKEEGYRQRGGKFILPMPEPKIV